jgi:hypothetical protein
MLAVLLATSTRADTNIHLTLSPAGLLSWTNANPDLHYTVEWRPSLDPTNEWTGSFRSLQDIHSSNAVITVAVPMFFRLIGSTGALHTLTLGPDTASIAEGYYAATNLTAVNPDFSADNIRFGVTVFGVEGQLLPAGGTATPADVAAGKTFFGLNQTNWTLQAGTAGNWTCPPGFFDLNGIAEDECEFQLDPQGIYVSTSDPWADDGPDCGLGPLGTGSGRRPCRTISRGIQRAAETGRTSVHVANGVYQESLTLLNGVNLKGAYRPGDWSRNVEESSTIVRGNNTGLHKKTVSGAALSQPLTIEGFIFFGQPADQPSGNSYVVWLHQSSAPVTLRRNMLFAANGADGARGADGVAGADGPAGSAGVNAIAPSSCLPRAGGAGASGMCGGISVSGGHGGGNACPPTYNTQASGLSGANGAGIGGGNGGSGGFDARKDSGGLCVLPTAGGMDGLPGAKGVNGANGGAGAGGALASGTISPNEWVGSVGLSGAAGKRGAGGGGGGAGGGAQNNGGGLTLGGTGGGGGAGGCGGGAGLGGGAGGASIAIFANLGTAPIVEYCVLYLARGGKGGDGGAGGMLGQGGGGGIGGGGSVCSGQGGDGGNGGQGGWGGGGGGGGGGASYGILVNGATSVPNYSAQNAFMGGTGGPGGTGGQSFGAAGGAGTAGQMQSVNIR